MDIERYENKLLDRIELTFTLRHKGKSTPSRKEILHAILRHENVKNPELVIIKNCSTRFGQAMTTGLAYIYDSEEAMKVEPSYIFKRHENLREAEPEEVGGSNEESSQTDGGEE
jgi:ribosomal protein S24E